METHLAKSPRSFISEGPLKRGLTQLEEGESWLLEPRCDPNNPRLWSPGIKIGVQKTALLIRQSFLARSRCDACTFT